MDIIIRITDSSINTGPTFNLYSNVDNYTTPFVTNINKSSLLSGYYTNLAPANTTTVRVKSVGPTCNNYIDVPVLPPTTTTTTTFPVTIDFVLEEYNGYPYANPAIRTRNYTGGSGKYQISVQPFATEASAQNPGNYSLYDYTNYDYLASSNQPPTNIGWPPGTYWIGVRDTENPRNKRVKSIVLSPLPVTKPFTAWDGTTGNAQDACSSPNVYNNNLRFSGSDGDYPTVGDRLYTALGTPYILSGSWIKASNGHALQGNSSGFVISDINCNTTTTTTTQLPNVWYKMSACGSAAILNSISYQSGRFSVGQVVMDGNDYAVPYIITEVLTTQPAGTLISIFGTNLASCPTVLPGTFTSTNTTAACNFSGIPFPIAINIGATGICDATTIYSQFSYFFAGLSTIYVSNVNAPGSYKQFTVSQDGKSATAVGSCVNCSTGFKSFMTNASISQTRVNACARTLNTTLSFQGPGIYPTIGDSIYINPLGGPVALGGWIKLANNHVIHSITSTISDDFNCSLIPTTTTTTTGIVPPVTTTTTTTTAPGPLNFDLEASCNIVNQKQATLTNISGGSNYYYISNQVYPTQQAALDGEYYSTPFTTGKTVIVNFSVPAGTWWMAIKDALNPSDKLAKPMTIFATCPFPTTTTTTTTINPNVQNTLYMGFPTPNTTWISFELLPL